MIWLLVKNVNHSSMGERRKKFNSILAIINSQWMK